MHLSGKKILVVDDNESFLDMLVFALKTEGFKVTGVQDGLEALTQAKHIKPDLIILDLMIPHLDGHKVCRLIKRDREIQHIPVLIITSRDTDEDRTKAKEDGAEGFLAKPATVDEILTTIEDLLP